MATTTMSSAFDPNPAEVRRMNRVIGWSVVVHVALVGVLLLTPRSWWTSQQEERRVMTISLGGAPGPETTGMTSVGGRTVEQVSPVPPTPQVRLPAPPAETGPSSAPAVRATPPPPPPPSTAPPRQQRPATTQRPQESAPRAATRAPVTGTQATQGSRTVDTGATGQGAGLASGGRIAGGEAALADFCCPEYVSLMLARIDSRWNKNQPERGTTVITFTIQRDGTVTNVVVSKPSGYGTLDRAARNALDGLRLPPLPAAYDRETLTVHLTFPYGS